MTVVRVHIDRLTVDASLLNGRPPGELGAALEEGLGQLLRDGGAEALSRSAADLHLDAASPVHMTAEPVADRFDAGLAQAVYRAVTRP